MSNLEYIIWHVLGYMAIPFIILSGFVVVSAVSIFLFSLWKDKHIE